MAKELQVPQFQATTASPKSPMYSMIHHGQEKKRETIKTCLAFDKEVFTRIKIYAAAHGTNVSALISSYFEELLAKENPDGQQ